MAKEDPKDLHEIQTMSYDKGRLRKLDSLACVRDMLAQPLESWIKWNTRSTLICITGLWNYPQSPLIWIIQAASFWEQGQTPHFTSPSSSFVPRKAGQTELSSGEHD